MSPPDMRTLDHSPDCPSAEDLARIVHGGLAVDLVEQLERHIDHCESCRVVVSGLALGSTARPLVTTDHVGLSPVDADHYVLGDEIARGGMGRIVHARDRRLGRPVAIKELLHADPEARVRFDREAHPRVLAKLCATFGGVNISTPVCVPVEADWEVDPPLFGTCPRG